MHQEKIKALAEELAKDLKTPADLNALSAQLTKITVEAALNAEMQEHLGYAPYEAKGRANTNSRNGYTTKTLKGDHGEIEIATPRDREATFRILGILGTQYLIARIISLRPWPFFQIST